MPRVVRILSEALFSHWKALCLDSFLGSAQVFEVQYVLCMQALLMMQLSWLMSAHLQW